MSNDPEVLIVTEQQFQDGYRSWDGKRGQSPDDKLEIQRHRYEVIEGPRPDRTYLVRAPGFQGIPKVEYEILRRVAMVLDHEERMLKHPDKRRGKAAKAWVAVCESALRGNPADRTEALSRYVELAGLGALPKPEDGR